jgi:hypothetical protein
MARPKQEELAGVEGPGVSPIKIKELDRLGDRFIENRDAKADLAAKCTKIEAQMAEMMEEHGLARYQFSDQEMILKRGKVHVKIKTVKVEGVEGNGD